MNKIDEIMVSFENFDDFTLNGSSIEKLDFSYSVKKVEIEKGKEKIKYYVEELELELNPDFNEKAIRNQNFADLNDVTENNVFKRILKYRDVTEIILRKQAFPEVELKIIWGNDEDDEFNNPNQKSNIKENGNLELEIKKELE